MKNVLVITTDQQHYMTLGFNNKEINTPNLDALANSGINFERAYCPNPTCTPSRASIITGQYPSQHKAWTLGTKLDEKTHTIGDLLNKNNIRTSLFGKAHFQQLFEDKEKKYSSLESYPNLQDFSFWENYSKRFYGFEEIKLLRNHTNESHVGQHYGLWLNKKVGSDWKNYFLENTGEIKNSDYIKNKISPLGQFPQGDTWDIPLELHYNEFIAGNVIEKIEDYYKQNESFMIWASFPDPHPDYLVPEPYATMYDPEKMTISKSYYENEYQPSELLIKTRQEDPNFDEYNETNTAIHGCSSHIQDEKSLCKDIALYYGMITYIDDKVGEIIKKLKDLNIFEKTLIIFTTDHGHYYGQHNLIRKGPFMYEDAIRIPFIVAGAGYDYNSINNTELVSLIDIYPTIAKYYNFDYNEYDIAGKSLIEIFDKKEKINFRDSIICEFRHEPYKLNLRTMIEKRFKITITANVLTGEIYDLKNDPLEMINLWENIDLRNELLLRMLHTEMNKELLHMPRICGA